MLRGRAEVPDVRVAAPRLEGVAGHLVARPLADVGARDVADVVEVEQQDGADLGGVERARARVRTDSPQAVDVPALLPVDIHRARRGKGSRHRSTPMLVGGTGRLSERGIVHPCYTSTESAQVRQIDLAASVRRSLHVNATHVSDNGVAQTVQLALDTRSLTLHTRAQPRTASSTVEEITCSRVISDAIGLTRLGGLLGVIVDPRGVQRFGCIVGTGVRRRPVDRPERGGQRGRPELQRRRQDPRDRVPVVRGRQQLRRADARRRPGRRGRRERQADRVRRERSTPPPRPSSSRMPIASGKYDAIITQPLYGAGLVEDVKKAIAAGIAVGNIDQVLGSDMTTAELAGRGPERERRVRPERARSQDRRARRRGLCRSQGQPVQRRLHLVGQGRRARHRAQGRRSTGDREPSRDQGRVRQR